LQHFDETNLEYEDTQLAGIEAHEGLG